MLKRANIALMGAVAPGFLAYTGWVPLLTPAARVVALVLLGFAAVSFLLSFFDDEDPAISSTTTEDVKRPQLVLTVSEQQVARVAP
jgi:hypothetical protein